MTASLMSTNSDSVDFEMVFKKVEVLRAVGKGIEEKQPVELKKFN